MVTSIAYPQRDHLREAFQMFAVPRFRDRLRDPLRRSDFDPDSYHHRQVEDAWQAWKMSADCMNRENERLRTLVDEIAKHTLKDLVITFDPGAPL